MSHFILAEQLSSRRRLSTAAVATAWNPQVENAVAGGASAERQNGTMAGKTIRTSEVVTVGSQPVRVIRSSRRTRNISARWREGMIEISVPMRLSRAQVTASVERMVTKMQRRVEARHDSDPELHLRARQLSATWLGGSVEPTEVVWSTRQVNSWGSCSSATGRIRISAKLKRMPQWVQDGVLIHELAHLKHPNHGPEFQAFANQYPQLAEAMAFLEGVTFATELTLDGATEYGGIASLNDDTEEDQDQLWSS